jgi:serine protease AprX
MKFFNRRSTFLPLLCALALLVPGAGGLSTSAAGLSLPVTLDPSLNIHPLLQAAAQTYPERTVRVIVRKTSPLVDSAAIALLLGTRPVEDFPFVQSLTLDVPLAQVGLLAHLPGVSFVSIDGPVIHHAVDASQLATTYEAAIGVPAIWNATSGTRPATGAGVGVAVLDSGVNASLQDFTSGSHLIAVNVNSRATGPQDGYGHGTHVAGIINGRDPQGRYIGVAPDATVVSVKISDDNGASTEADLIRGLQWVQTNRAKYNLRVVNLSVSTAIPASYLVSPVAAAVEQLWQSGVVVVASSGNKGSARDATWAAPGGDPYIITVGALDTNQTVSPADDTLASFSSRGKTQDGIYKPEIVAPGRKIVAPLAGPDVTLARELPSHIVDSTHIRLSGTSMSAPVTAGVVALLLQAYPNLTPDQVKWLLVNTEHTYPGQADSAGVVDPLAAIKRAAAGNIGRANQGLTPSGSGLVSTVTNTLFGLVASVTNLASLVVDPAYWDAGHWDAGHWDGGHWDAGYWDAGHWDAGYWDAGHWDAGYWDAGHWDASPQD